MYGIDIPVPLHYETLWPSDWCSMSFILNIFTDLLRGVNYMSLLATEMSTSFTDCYKVHTAVNIKKSIIIRTKLMRIQLWTLTYACLDYSYLASHLNQMSQLSLMLHIFSSMLCLNIGMRIKIMIISLQPKYWNSHVLMTVNFEHVKITPLNKIYNIIFMQSKCI